MSRGRKSENKKTRHDFVTWQEWCEYNRQKVLQKSVKLVEQAEEWEKKKNKEQLTLRERKLKTINKYQEKINQIQKEINEEESKLVNE